MIVNIPDRKLSIEEAIMTLSLERMARLLLGILWVNAGGRRRIPRLDLMALSERDLADLNLPADVRSRVSGKRATPGLRHRG
jgi:hypothetical protein